MVKGILASLASLASRGGHLKGGRSLARSALNRTSPGAGEVAPSIGTGWRHLTPLKPLLRRLRRRCRCHRRLLKFVFVPSSSHTQKIWSLWFLLFGFRFQFFFFFFLNFFFRLLNFWSVPKLVPILVSFNFGGFQRLRYVERGANVLTGHRRRCHGNVNGRHSVAIQLLIDDVTITTD